MRRSVARASTTAGTIREGPRRPVLLETDELIVRGEARIRIPRAVDSTRVASHAGVVTVTSPTATVSLTLGESGAEKWQKKSWNRRSD